MYSFEGVFKRKPIQSLGGFSRNEKKDELLQKTQEARRLREVNRRQITSSILIQSFYRGCKVREFTRTNERALFDQKTKQLSKVGTATIDVATISELCRCLIFFFKTEVDGQRLTWLCQTLVKHQNLGVELIKQDGSIGLYQLKQILQLCCRHLEYLCEGSAQIASPLRMIEVYTNPKTFQKDRSAKQAEQIVWNVIISLIQNGYYHCMRVLLESKVPASVERTTTAPTPISATIYDLIRSPLNFVTESTDIILRDNVLRSLCIEFFSQPYSDQIKEFLLPALAYNQKPFPFIELLHALVPVEDVSINVKRPRSKGSNGKTAGFNGEKNRKWCPNMTKSPWLLYAVSVLGDQHIEHLKTADLRDYLLVLHHLVPSLELLKPKYTGSEEESDDEDDMEVEYSQQHTSAQEVEERCMSMLNEPHHVKTILKAVQQNPSQTLMTAICTVCHALMVHNKLAVNKSRLLYTLAFHPQFLRNLWHVCITASTKTVTGSQTALIQMICRGLDIDQEDVRRIVPLLSVFTSLFSYCILSLHDSEFYAECSNQKSSMPFTIAELVPMILALRDTCLGIIELAHPETRPEVKEEYKQAFQSVGVCSNQLTTEQLRQQRQTWGQMFKVMSHLVKQLYSRDSRRSFCPPGHWLSNQANIQADQQSNFYRNSDLFVRRRFGELGALNPDRSLNIEDGPPLSTKEVRKLTILQELPFIVSFQERVKIFLKLVQQDRFDQQGEMRYLSGESIRIIVRRNFIYEDAFEKLSVDNEPNLKLRLQVQLINFAGANEAGIDGGGLFREFMWELLKTSFDPNRGFFKYTSDNMLYPNPHAKLLNENFASHYYFLGRMLGKAIFENMLVELPFASFFLSKILSRHRGDVDIHHLASLDPEMYKNLLFLKNYNGDVKDLELDFTVTHNELGEIKEEELKLGGKQIPVDNNNRIEYIHLMADYMLNRRIREQCNAFRNGLTDVVNIEWLRMFNHNELQVLISGAPAPIDVDDMRRHTNYSGGYNDGHPCIKLFWHVVEEFTDAQKRCLLKFVTSCSRSPLLGFKDLYPAFCVHYAGSDEERLPTASTCMNLLKLPEFTDENIMKQKLLYAVESGAGFELS